jgi:arylsulfatase A-like enzyme
MIHCFRLLFVLLALLLTRSLYAAEQPNIVVVFTDDQTFNAIGYNNPEVSTPNLDSLAKAGLIFDRAYVASPICAASRASMMTGLFPQQHKVVALANQNFSPYRAGGSDANLSLASQLNRLGYRTVAYGKSHLGDPKNFGFIEGEETGPHDDVDTFARVGEFVASDRAKEKPFFLWVAPKQPHVPLLPAQRWLDLYKTDSLELSDNFRITPLLQSINNQGLPGEEFYRDSKYINNWKELPAGPPRDQAVMRGFIHAYYAVISHLDHQIGTLVKQMKDAGLWENTIFFFLSDNGYHLGSHGLGNKITMHEESVRVPMFAVGLGVPKGKRSTALVSSLDLYPTVLKIAGIESVPKHAMGLALQPILQNSRAGIREAVFSEGVGVDGLPGQGHRMARTTRYKYVLTGTDEEYLFDEEADPSELKNLIHNDGLRGERDALRQHLKSWMKQIGDRPFPENTK